MRVGHIKACATYSPHTKDTRQVNISNALCIDDYETNQDFDTFLNDFFNFFALTKPSWANKCMNYGQ